MDQTLSTVIAAVPTLAVSVAFVLNEAAIAGLSSRIGNLVNLSTAPIFPG